MAAKPQQRSKFATSWVDTMKEHHAADQLPPPTEKIEGDTKIVTEYKFNEEGKKVKTTKTYQIVRNEVTKGMLKRRQWRPFGKIQSEDEKREATNTEDEVLMQFINQKDTVAAQDDPWVKAFEANKNLFKCRVCNGSHATAQCPLGGQPEEPGDMLGLSRLNSTTNKYVPRPQLMEQSGRPSASMSMRLREDMNTIRVTNLPGDMQDSDIKDLFGQVGRISRIFLARDKFTGASKGYAFVSFDKHESALLAVKTFNGFGYSNLILKVELARPT
jgi:translation initiation factor 3 subunit G